MTLQHPTLVEGEHQAVLSRPIRVITVYQDIAALVLVQHIDEYAPGLKRCAGFGKGFVDILTRCRAVLQERQ